MLQRALAPTTSSSLLIPYPPATPTMQVRSLHHPPVSMWFDRRAGASVLRHVVRNRIAGLVAEKRLFWSHVAVGSEADAGGGVESEKVAFADVGAQDGQGAVSGLACDDGFVDACGSGRGREPGP